MVSLGHSVSIRHRSVGRARQFSQSPGGISQRRSREMCRTGGHQICPVIAPWPRRRGHGGTQLMRGRLRTLFLIDRAAAAEVPAQVGGAAAGRISRAASGILSCAGGC